MCIRNTAFLPPEPLPSNPQVFDVRHGIFCGGLPVNERDVMRKLAVVASNWHQRLIFKPMGSTPSAFARRWIVHMSYWIVHMSYWIVHMSYWIVHMSYWIVHMSYWIVHMSYWIVHMSYWIVHMSYWIVHMSYHCSHVTHLLQACTRASRLGRMPSTQTGVCDFSLYIVHMSHYILHTCRIIHCTHATLHTVPKPLYTHTRCRGAVLCPKGADPNNRSSPGFVCMDTCAHTHTHTHMFTHTRTTRTHAHAHARTHTHTHIHTHTPSPPTASCTWARCRQAAPSHTTSIQHMQPPPQPHFNAQHTLTCGTTTLQHTTLQHTPLQHTPLQHTTLQHATHTLTCGAGRQPARRGRDSLRERGRVPGGVQGRQVGLACVCVCVMLMLVCACVWLCGGCGALAVVQA
jgi:hypothetical protein